ncbi:MAG: membrane protein insertion efficiency factor YidD [Alphaproteobacteria bacterium]|nr:membrane protein insertion efficiency factor YidD [Alphaproteobacteria bacterium]
MRLPGLILRGAIQLYRYGLSPLKPPTCRFYPSCSDYALEAVTRHGARAGGWLALRRVARCHPWNPGGVDPVPEAEAGPRRMAGPDKAGRKTAGRKMAGRKMEGRAL